MKEDEKLLIIIISSFAAFILFVGCIISIFFFGIFSTAPFQTKPVMSEPTPYFQEDPLQPTIMPSQKCIVGGCNGEVCSESGEGGISTCIWKEEFSCYKKPFAKCERQLDGNCGWTENTELNNCISEAKKQDSN